jgi:hypothetical protein
MQLTLTSLLWLWQMILPNTLLLAISLEWYPTSSPTLPVISENVTETHVFL